MKRIWTTKDGKKLNIKDMDTSHITNCITMLKRQKFGRFLRACAEGYSVLRMVNGEMATLGIEADLSRLENEGEIGDDVDKLIDDYIESFERELSRRGMTLQEVQDELRFEGKLD